MLENRKKHDLRFIFIVSKKLFSTGDRSKIE